MTGGHDMPGMMSDQDTKALEKAPGEDFDRMFLEMMIKRHQARSTWPRPNSRKARIRP
jgi:uncharacterized protein (DUF305 family)